MASRANTLLAITLAFIPALSGFGVKAEEVCIDRVSVVEDAAKTTGLTFDDVQTVDGQVAVEFAKATGFPTPLSLGVELVAVHASNGMTLIFYMSPECAISLNGQPAQLLSNEQTGVARGAMPTQLFARMLAALGSERV